MKKILFAILPPWLLSRILEWKERIKVGNRGVYFSQFGEDIVLQYLTRSKKMGYYVDVGANHPIRHSNTYLLYTRGWNGINVEPDPFSISLLRRKRARDINIQCGIGNAGKATFYRFSNSRMNSFSKEAADEAKRRGYHLIEEITVPLVPLSKILEDNPLPSLDVMNIDAEGYDLEILKSNDWSRFRPTLIVVEIYNLDFENPKADPVYNFLRSEGYSLVARTGYSAIFRS